MSLKFYDPTKCPRLTRPGSSSRPFPSFPAPLCADPAQEPVAPAEDHTEGGEVAVEVEEELAVLDVRELLAEAAEALAHSGHRGGALKPASENEDESEGEEGRERNSTCT